MIVPRYWAEARVHERAKGRPVIVRRFGWSDVSQDDAVEVANTRAQEALRRVLAGEPLPRRERKLPYNGAEGVPIREEVVSQHHNVVVTRNAYGARCLNTPNVLFVDIDFTSKLQSHATLAITTVLVVIALAAGFALHSWLLAIGLAVVAVVMSGRIAALVQGTPARTENAAEQSARERITRFLQAHPEAHLRIYRTPAGLRVLAMHKTFDPRGSEVAEYFQALGTDPNYARMCKNQQCFRARVSPKPWRMGIAEHMRPRPGTWPVRPERIPDRVRWVEKYEQAATGYAACRFIESLGSPAVNPDAHTVQALHDELCRAQSTLPIA